MSGHKDHEYNLRNNVAALLNLDIEVVLKYDFFDRECYLTDVWYDNNPSAPGEVPFPITKVSKYKVNDPSTSLGRTEADKIPLATTECICGQQELRWNFVVLHHPTHQFFILGSSCVKLFSVNAFKNGCEEASCGNVTDRVDRKYCPKHVILCPKHKVYHLDGKVHANCKICYHPRVFTDFRNQKICFPCFKKNAKAGTKHTSQAENSILADLPLRAIGFL